MGVQFRGVLFDIGIHIRQVGCLGDKKQPFLMLYLLIVTLQEEQILI